MNPKKITAAIFAAVITVSLFIVPVLAAMGIASENELVSAISAGGDYEITADISAANAGINKTPSEGTINGNSHTITKSNAQWNDAVLYQNCAGSWTFSNMTIDGGKSMGTFTDAALWYMAGTVKFENVTIRNFKTSKADRYAINCNGTADMTLKDVIFKDNENASASILNPDVYIDGGTLHLSGGTSANVYYTGGSVDIAELTKNCIIKITADNADNYKKLKNLSPASASVKITYDDNAKSVSITGSGISWELNAEKSYPENGKVNVAVTVSSYIDEDKDVSIYAASYNADKALTSINMGCKEIPSNSSIKEEFELQADDTDTIIIYLWEKETMKPLTKKLYVTTVKEKNIVMNCDFENPQAVTPLIYGGAYISGGKGISGNCLTFDGTNGYMQLPNNILTDSMTFMIWAKTDVV